MGEVCFYLMKICMNSAILSSAGSFGSYFQRHLALKSPAINPHKLQNISWIMIQIKANSNIHASLRNGFLSDSANESVITVAILLLIKLTWANLCSLPLISKMHQKQILNISWIMIQIKANYIFPSSLRNRFLRDSANESVVTVAIRHSAPPLLRH